MSAAADVTQYREHLTLDECNSLLHYSHSHPICTGKTARYVESHCPGWTWNRLVLTFVAAGIFINRGGSPAKCDDSVVMFHFSSPTEFHVEFADGVEPAAVRERRLANDRSIGQYAYPAGRGFIASLGGEEPPED